MGISRIMASRKLKFKPKPVVGGSVRRARDKDDLTELKSIEPIISEKETVPTSDKSVENLIIPIQTDNLVNITNSVRSPITDFKIEHSKLIDSLILPLKPTVDHYNSNVDHHNESSNCGFQITSKEDYPADITSKKLKTSSEQQETILTGISFNVINLNKAKIPKQNETNSLSVCNDSISTKDSTVSDKSSDNPCIAKVFPRFGRSRCKPVLNNPELRKKSDVKPDFTDVISVRTESVIKSVKSELNKFSPIVAEITESFSLLESDEPEPLYSQDCVFETETVVLPKVKSCDNRSETLQEGDKQQTLSDVPQSVSCESVVINENQTIKKELCLSKSAGKTKIFVAKLYESNCTNHASKNVYQSNGNNAEILNSNLTSANVLNKVPISPQRATSKILVPKPSPRLSDIIPRRISFQESDSEDEVKRKKNDLAKTSTKDEKEKNIKNSKRKRSQGSTYTKMGQDTLEKFSKRFGNDEHPDKTKLTMIDLIFYNPKNNPMTLNPQQSATVQKKEEKIEVSESVEEALAEQNVDDVEPAAVMPVPQLKVGPDGQIMLDPKSLVIETTGTEKSRAELENSQVIQESGITRYSTYSKRKHQRKDWTPQETLQFYRALNTIGSDFALMTQLFPKRSRHELKLKFKREEKLNMALIDKAMTAPTDFDFKSLEEELRLENEEIEKKAVEKILNKEAAKKARQEKLKDKVKKKSSGKQFHKGRTSAFKDFNETDHGKQHIIKQESKRLRRRKPHAKKTESGLIDSDLEDELQIELDSDSPDEDEGLSIIKMVKQTRTGRLLKPTTKLEEYEEINETLKQKLCHESDSEDDLYTPNGPGAHMLFGNPHEVPNQEMDERPWNIEITSLPTIEETVLIDQNVESVSEISELGSFGQNDTALDLSMPIRANIGREFLQERQTDSSLLNRHIISQSIQIIDQLTSNVENNIYAEGEVLKDNVSNEIPTKEEQVDGKIPLPSFDSVSRSRPSMVYSLPQLEGPFLPVDCNSENEIQGSSNAPSIVLANYYNEECILGD